MKLNESESESEVKVKKVKNTPVFDRIEKRKVLQTSVDVGLEHFLFIS